MVSFVCLDLVWYSADWRMVAELCSPGTVSADGFTPCQPCLSGYYQSREGSVTCDLCPPGTWTSGSGATGPEDCVGEYFGQ